MNVEKLAEEVYGKGVNHDYEEGFVDGYNKAKETLYTELPSDEEPALQRAVFVFNQDGNCVDGGFESIEIRCEASLGIDNDEGCFYVLKTEQWSFDSLEELQKLIDRISKVINK